MAYKTSSLIEQRVMRRVRIMRAAGVLASGKLLAAAVVLVALWGIGREVWVARVFQNAPSLADLKDSIHFWTAAFLNTRTVVQVLSLVVLVAVVYLAREAVRLLSIRSAPAFR